MNAYVLNFVFDKKKPLKTAFLVLAIGIDIFDVAFLVSAVSGHYVDFVFVAVGIVLTLALRLPTQSMTFEIKYVFKDGLVVTKIYPHKKETLFCLGGDFEIYCADDGKNAELLANAEKLYVYEPKEGLCVIRVDGKYYALAFDDYMLALVLSFYGKQLG